MDSLFPEDVLKIIYKFEHEMWFSDVTKQLKSYRLKTAFNVPISFLESAYFGIVKLKCININNINASPYQILCLIRKSDLTRLGSIARRIYK